MSVSMRRMRVIDKWKLDHKESAKLSRFLDGIQYTCGNSFKGLTSEVQQDEFSGLFLKVKVNDKLNSQNPNSQKAKKC
ncbi:16875_t:CDS:2 [Entrophospora sp. SA101]|nr:31_t:CDS:2 [Entrophospora sp. SA101]CAJ0646524.1 5120_t:CDS:2 [Entrophospora sp. SA101]CAJ0753437.1 16875_t:CDS:2 [Entrophospora sp. SA101]CAJ0890439.1 12101_t:CDS:2 [Entrophospora sp. SA101]